MADSKNQGGISNATSRRIDRNLKNVDGIMNDLNNSVFGVDTSDEVSELKAKFNEIMRSELDGITKGDSADVTSFINKLYSKMKNDDAFNRAIDQDFLQMNLDGMDSTIAAFMDDRYKNRILKQADIQEVSSQLIELNEAVSTMRDAVFSPDINTGRINREIVFGDSDSDRKEYYTQTVEAFEKKFDLSRKLKDFIGINALKQGEYYVYCAPYSYIFNEFMKKKRNLKSANMYSFHESVEEESAEDVRKIYSLESDDDVETFAESCYDNYYKPSVEKANRNGQNVVISKRVKKEEYVSEMKEILGRVTVNMEEIPLPVLEEGLDSIEEFREQFVNESGDMFVEKKNGERLVSTNNSFKNYMDKNASREGTFFLKDDTKGPSKNEFKDIKDCYIKMVSAMQLIPITMMDEEIGYLYMKAEDATPVAGLVSTGLYNKRYDENSRERNIVSDIAARIVNRFDKKFLKENPKFKKMIVEALNYYDLTENRISFQFVPKEYIFPFKVNVDENGHGVSMLENSLFYAKLYLMLLLFKMMSILLYSNDQKVNYVRQSGINKDLANKTQDIIRQKQARQINMMDLFSYTTLINKVGSGAEMYVPTGRQNERPFETEILSGQDVQINTELMELLRNSYILGTGVPSAIMNYLNEADFAKSIETANSKFNGRVVSVQLDLNPQITRLYRAIARWSTNIPEDVIEQMEFILPTPKNAQNNVTQEMIQNFSATSDFLTQLYYGEQGDPNNEVNVKIFKKKLARKKLTIINWDEVDRIFEESEKEAQGEKLEPKSDADDENTLDI